MIIEVLNTGKYKGRAFRLLSKLKQFMNIIVFDDETGIVFYPDIMVIPAA